MSSRTDHVLAVDLGGTKTAIAIVDGAGAMRERRTLAAARSLVETVRQIADACHGVEAVGIIVPGIYTPATGHAWCPNLWGADEVPLRRALEARVGAQTFIDSDRSGYVLGESWLGAARGLRHVAFVAIGTGIGVGILSDGVVLRGAGGIAGAAGWFALNPEWQEPYGRLGCWEAEAAGPALAASFGARDARLVVDAAREGDDRAAAVLERAAAYTAMGVANLISAFNPEAVVLGGGLMAGAGDLVLDHIRSEAARWAQPRAFAQCRIELSQLGEAAGLLGAARLALDGI
ncbi:MAG TPA: ROK family protein [Vicinamibacterales bacterium]|nr:ROK family protein [Vicinamibacterales bacterium]